VIYNINLKKLRNVTYVHRKINVGDFFYYFIDGSWAHETQYEIIAIKSNLVSLKSVKSFYLKDKTVVKIDVMTGPIKIDDLFKLCYTQPKYL
jgi:hypothetical protein